MLPSIHSSDSMADPILVLAVSAAFPSASQRLKSKLVLLRVDRSNAVAALETAAALRSFSALTSFALQWELG